jgi:hypothetical protein
MAKDQRNLLDVLKSELEFLESGGYGKPSRAKWRPQFVFEDSPTCLNYANPSQRKPCNDCVLIDLVPEGTRKEKIPCRHIPLNAQGETVDSLYRSGTQEELDAAVAAWLKSTICRLGSEQRGSPLDLEKADASNKARAGSG